MASSLRVQHFNPEPPRARIHQPFSRTFFVIFSKILYVWKKHNFWLAETYGLAN